VDATEQPLRDHEERGTVVIGWIGSRTTSPYVEWMGSLVGDLRRRGVDGRLVLVGADRSLGGQGVEVRDWAPEREKADLASFDIGVMPLPDDEWARGKCGYKLLQYFAAGVPAVASPVGITPELIGENRGLVARDRTQWLDALEALARDALARREIGLHARAFVESQYSYERWAPEFASLLRSL
jgi:glycosyltransferase involved in cell wall biosynthesis